MAVREQKDPREKMLDVVVNELGQDLSTSLDFISSEFERSRARAQRYYNGRSDLQVDANRSRYVATKVRDVIRSVRPSLMRVFAVSENPVLFVPQTVAQGMISEAQTTYITQLFNDLGGYNVIYSAFHSAMLFKLGVVKYWYDETADPIYRKYTGLTEQHMQMITAHPAVEIIAADETQHPGPQGMVRTFSIEIVGRKMSGDIEMAWVPLSEFLIDRNASCKDDARVIAHRRNVLRGDAVAMGFDPELLEQLNSDNAEVSYFAEESDARRGYTVFPSDDTTRDESMQDILLTEAYYRADLDGSGIPQLYKFSLGGTSYRLLDYERVDQIPFALFSIDPEPGTVFGKSLYDLTEQEQDANTSLTRATIDNFHMNNNPRLAVHEHMVDMESVLNNDLGAPIRVRAAGQIQVISTPFTGAAALPLLQFLEKDLENKTGVTRASAGLDPDAMQSTDKDAVQNTIQLAQGQVELMARNLAETGMKDLFGGLLHLAMTHLDTNQILRQGGQNTPVRLDVFDPKMKLVAAVGLGTGSYDEKMTMLDHIYGVQKEAMKQFGPGNPLVSMMQMQNTLNDKMRMVSMYNPARYFNQVTPDAEKKFAEQFQKNKQAQQAAQKEIAGMQANALANAEKIKGQVKIQTETAKNQLDMAKTQQSGMIDAAQLKQKEDASFRELMVTDDLARDKMVQDLYIAVMDLKEDFAKASMQTRRAMT